MYGHESFIYTTRIMLHELENVYRYCVVKCGSTSFYLFIWLWMVLILAGC